MNAFFVICAVAGGTILICQFVMMLVGVGGDLTDLGGGDGHIELGGHDVDVSSPDGHDALGHHGSTWLFGVLSFRTLVAAATFFGLGGLAAGSLGQGSLVQGLAAMASGVAAMYVVHAVLTLFAKLAEDGTVRITRAVGSEATVYLPIPPNRTGTGKIHLSLQHRLMEYPAVTGNGEKLAAGSKVVVTGVVGTDTLEVAPRGSVEAA
jgi:hypothetical protein